MKTIALLFCCVSGVMLAISTSQRSENAIPTVQLTPAVANNCLPSGCESNFTNVAFVRKLSPGACADCHGIGDLVALTKSSPGCAACHDAGGPVNDPLLDPVLHQKSGNFPVWW